LAPVARARSGTDKCPISRMWAASLANDVAMLAPFRAIVATNTRKTQV